MKRNYLFKNTGRLLLATGLLVTTLLSSCLKDNSPGTINFGKSPALIGFQYAGFQAVPYTVAILPNAGQVYTTTQVTLSVASLTLGSAVTATLSVDNAGFAAYAATDTAGGKKDNLLPAADYQVASTVTIPAGQQIVTIPITFAGNAIDFTQNYILALHLTNASGAEIASNLSSAIYIITLKSPYQGHYTVTGTLDDTFNSALTGTYPISGVYLNTVSADQVQFVDPAFGLFHQISNNGTSSYYGNFDPIFTFTNGTAGIVSSVSNYYVGNSQNRTATINSAVTPTSTGTPGTAGFSFTVGYILVQAGTNRTFFDETFTYTGP
jgi:hypothetical protein